MAGRSLAFREYWQSQGIGKGRLQSSAADVTAASVDDVYRGAELAGRPLEDRVDVAVPLVVALPRHHLEKYSMVQSGPSTP